MTNAERLTKIETKLDDLLKLMDKNDHEKRIRSLELKQGSFLFGGSMLFKVFLFISIVVGTINIVMSWAK